MFRWTMSSFKERYSILVYPATCDSSYKDFSIFCSSALVSWSPPASCNTVQATAAECNISYLVGEGLVCVLLVEREVLTGLEHGRHVGVRRRGVGGRGGRLTLTELVTRVVVCMILGSSHYSSQVGTKKEAHLNCAALCPGSSQ